jgi:RNA polymerase sigma-70 factor (ECF subfamily)
MIHEAQAPDAQRGGAALSDDLLEMLEELDEIDRALVILKYAENYSYEELASIFELSVSACKMRVSRARDRVQRKYADF